VPLTFGQKLLMLLLVAIVMPTAISVLAFGAIMQTYLDGRSEHDGASLGNVLARSLADHFDKGWTRGDRVLMDFLASDDSIAFICVTDSAGRPIHMSVQDAPVWEGYTAAQARLFSDGMLDVSRRVTVSHEGDGAVIRTIPIHQGDNAAAALLDQTIEPLGYVVLGVHDISLAAAARQYQLTQVLIAGAAAVLLAPIILWCFARWTRPLRHLRASVLKMTDGLAPDPLYVKEDDDVGRLVAAVNRMAGTVLATQRQLRETNFNLEGIVQQRTTELREAVRELEQLSTTDVLTGLANRRAFYGALERDFARATAFRGELGVLMIDLDGFKQVNDTLGHDAGDEVLITAAQAIMCHCDANMTPARLGGDEFVVLFRHLSRDECRAIALQISSAFSSMVNDMASQQPGHPLVTMSLGLAMLRETEAIGGDVLVAMADVALYRAKSLGRSQLVMFDPNMHAARSGDMTGDDADRMEAA